MRKYYKVKFILFGFTKHSNLQVDCKFTDIIISYLQATVEFKSYIESCIRILVYAQPWSSSFALPLYNFTSKESIRQFWEDLIQISCKELEHSITPCFFFEIGIEELILNSPAYHILIKVKGDVLLNPSENPE